MRKQSAVQLHVGTALESFEARPDGVQVRTREGGALHGDALVGADGLWSRVRQHLLLDAPPRATGHLAYRAMVEQQHLPLALRSQHVTVWMGASQHVVVYPVRRGQWLNVVWIASRVFRTARLYLQCWS